MKKHTYFAAQNHMGVWTVCYRCANPADDSGRIYDPDCRGCIEVGLSQAEAEAKAARYNAI